MKTTSAGAVGIMGMLAVLLWALSFVPGCFGLDPDSALCQFCPYADENIVACCDINGYCYYNSWTHSVYSCGQSDWYCCATWSAAFWVVSVLVPTAFICFCCVLACCVASRMRKQRRGLHYEPLSTNTAGDYGIASSTSAVPPSYTTDYTTGYSATAYLPPVYPPPTTPSYIAPTYPPPDSVNNYIDPSPSSKS
ncbi:hypothetical protein Pelo_17580 [Pelomyxa schiedti]|nr:hypothetical protein Pelo_17580 [Pelomyxa schiedti]